VISGSPFCEEESMRLHGPQRSAALASTIVAAALAVPLATLLHAQVAVCYAEWCITDQQGVERCVVKQIPCPS
jgi:hypothetical protein